MVLALRYLKKLLTLFFVAVIITIPIAFFLIDWGNRPAHAIKPSIPKEVVASKALILDLDGNGVDLASVKTNGAVYWNVDQDEFLEASAWTGANDGLLAIDRNGDGIINHHGELFSKGFSELSEFDDNSDKTLNAQDQKFPELLVWKDKNSDGHSEKEEVQTLEDLGISNINLEFNSADYEIQDNKISQESTFTIKGQNHSIVNAHLRYDNMNSIYGGKYEFIPRVLALPTLRGYGDIPDLFIAMSKDEKLLKMVKEISDADLKALVAPAFNLEGKIENITYRWAQVDDIDPSSRGENIDARKLVFLEKYIGDKYLQQGKSPNPKPHAASLLKELYRKTTGRLLNHLFIQRAGKIFYERGAKYNLHNGKMLRTDIEFVQLLSSKQRDIVSSEKGDAYIFASTSQSARINEKGGNDAIWLHGFKEEDVQYEKEENNLLVHLGEKTITIVNHFMPSDSDKGKEKPYAIEALVFDSGKRINLDENLLVKEH